MIVCPSIEIILPTYGVERFVDAALQSLCAQTFQDWQAYCIDDGSKDRSGELLDAAARQDARIRIIHQRNAKLSAARNRGLSYLRGEYFAFLDPDDCLTPWALEALFACAKKTDADLIWGDYIRVPEAWDGSQQEALPVEEEYIVTHRMNDRWLHPERKYNTMSWGGLWRLEALKGLTFRRDVRVAEDTDYCFKAFQRIKTLVKLYVPVVYYRLREGSATSGWQGRDFVDVIKVYADSAHGFVEDFSLSSAELKRVQRQMSRELKALVCTTIQRAGVTCTKEEIVQARQYLLKLEQLGISCVKSLSLVKKSLFWLFLRTGCPCFLRGVKVRK